MNPDELLVVAKTVGGEARGERERRKGEPWPAYDECKAVAHVLTTSP